MIHIKTPAQIAQMSVAGGKLYEVLEKLREAVRPGITTGELNAYADRLIRQRGAVPSFLNYRGYPASLCTSVDEQIVHAIPSEKVALKEGQIISLDCGLILDGWQADSAVTVGVGAISPEAQKLIRVTEACFWKAARQAVAGKRLGDISHAVQSHAEANGFGVIRALFGHGIGRLMHEDPEVPNFGEAGHGIRLRNGMTLAVEPMICSGDWQAEELDDGWTFVTCDRSPCAHYEHTIAISDDGLPRILTLPGFCWEEEDL